MIRRRSPGIWGRVKDTEDDELLHRIDRHDSYRCNRGKSAELTVVTSSVLCRDVDVFAQPLS